MGISGGPYIVRDSSLVLELDAADLNSYPRTGTIWSDLTSNRNNASLVNTPTFSNTNNGIIVTNGSTNYVSLTLPTIGSSYSISFWVNPLTLPAGTASELTLFGSPSDLASISFYAAVSNTYKFLSWNGSTGRSGNTTVTINNWYNFVMVNSGNTTFYLNGRSDGTFANTATLNSGASTIACINGNARFLNCNLAHIMFYSKGLSATEVSQNYNEQKSRFGL